MPSLFRRTSGLKSLPPLSGQAGRFLWKARQWWFRRLMLRDAKLSEISRHIAKARRSHAPVNHLYRMYSERVHQVLGGGL